MSVTTTVKKVVTDQTYATIGATDLWNHAGLSHRVLIAEGNELFLVPCPTSLVRRTVRAAAARSEELGRA